MFFLVNPVQQLVNGADVAIDWANTVGIGIMASIMAIALIQFLYDKT